MRVGGDDFGVLVEESTSRVEDGVEVFQPVEVLVDDGLIDEGPEMLGRLEFRCVGRQVDEAQAVRHGEVRPRVPACSVEHENDEAGVAGPDGSGEVGQELFEERLADAVRDIPDGLAVGRMHEGRDVEPLVAMMTKGDRPLSDGRPDPAPHRLETEPVLVGRPHLDGQIGMRFGFLDYGIGKLFLKASSSSGVAAFGFFGRGTWTENLSFFRASQPRGA